MMYALSGGCMSTAQCVEGVLFEIASRGLEYSSYDRFAGQDLVEELYPEKWGNEGWSCRRDRIPYIISCI
jgi:hypothetical protein